MSRKLKVKIICLIAVAAHQHGSYGHTAILFAERTLA